MTKHYESWHVCVLERAALGDVSTDVWEECWGTKTSALVPLPSFFTFAWLVVFIAYLGNRFQFRYIVSLNTVAGSVIIWAWKPQVFISNKRLKFIFGEVYITFSEQLKKYLQSYWHMIFIDNTNVFNLLWCVSTAAPERDVTRAPPSCLPPVLRWESLIKWVDNKYKPIC